MPGRKGRMPGLALDVVADHRPFLAHGDLTKAPAQEGKGGGYLALGAFGHQDDRLSCEAITFGIIEVE